MGGAIVQRSLGARAAHALAGIAGRQPAEVGLDGSDDDAAAEKVLRCNQHTVTHRNTP